MVLNELEESYYSGNRYQGSGCYAGRSIETRVFGGGSYMDNNWAQIAETTLPLKASKLANNNNQGQFQASIEIRSRQISTQVIVVNLISLLVNLALAIVAFYFSFVNNSPSTTAFAADCVLDFVSSAIVLWRYHGNLSSVYMQAREQIACIYLGALFEISGLAIIIKASSDMASDVSFERESGSSELVYLAIAATIACSVLTVFKCALYKTLRDNSILLDVINTLISTVFAMSIVMSQLLINVNPSFWYLDPILSIVLALFMMAFGIKVLHQNFNVLKPIYCSTTLNERSYQNSDKTQTALSFLDNNNEKQQERKTSMTSNYGSNLTNSLEQNRFTSTWQKVDYSSITFA